MAGDFDINDDDYLEDRHMTHPAEGPEDLEPGMTTPTLVDDLIRAHPLMRAYEELIATIDGKVAMTGELAENMNTLRATITGHIAFWAGVDKAATMMREELKALQPDADRWRWLKPYLYVAREQTSPLTAWLAVTEIPFRTDTRDAETLLDRMRGQWPVRTPR